MHQKRLPTITYKGEEKKVQIVNIKIQTYTKNCHQPFAIAIQANLKN